MFWKRKLIERGGSPGPSTGPTPTSQEQVPETTAMDSDLWWASTDTEDRLPSNKRRVHRTTRPGEGTYWGVIREEAPGEWRARIMVKSSGPTFIHEVLHRSVPKELALAWVDERLDAIASRDAGWEPA